MTARLYQFPARQLPARSTGTERMPLRSVPVIPLHHLPVAMRDEGYDDFLRADGTSRLGDCASRTVATHEPSRQSSLPSRPFRWVSTIANIRPHPILIGTLCTWLAAFVMAYFAAEFIGAAGRWL